MKQFNPPPRKGLTALAAVLAAVLATVPLPGPAGASSVTANNPAAYEGRDLTFTFRIAGPLWFHTCYDYRTDGAGDGTNAGHGDGDANGAGWRRDYIPTQGTLCWERGQGGQRKVTVETLNDVRCEHDETVRVILSNFRYYTRIGWEKNCGSGHIYPCQVTATGTIRQHETGCQAQQFGE